jgi:hypothetical protein
LRSDGKRCGFFRWLLFHEQKEAREAWILALEELGYSADHLKKHNTKHK